MPLSSPRFKRWALLQAKRQGHEVLVAVNSVPLSEFGDLDRDVTWIETPEGKPRSVAAAAKWLHDNRPGCIVVQHDQDDHYPDGSAAKKLSALDGHDVVGSAVRNVWFERSCCRHAIDRPLRDHWDTWGGSYAWRLDAFVPLLGPSRMYDDTMWLNRMLERGARFRGYETDDTYCRWGGHRHVWDADDAAMLRALAAGVDVPCTDIAREARSTGADEETSWKRL